MTDSKKPMAKIQYVCNKCGNSKFRYELYHYIYSIVKKQCGKCLKITDHKRIPPDDDNVMNYKRPTI